jgi:hypothetical protein
MGSWVFSSCQCSSLTGSADAEEDTDAPTDSSADLGADPVDADLDTRWADAPDWIIDVRIPGLDPVGCPPRGDVESEFIVDGDASPTSPVDIEQTCTVADISYHAPPDGVTVSLSCESGTAHTVDILPFPPFVVTLGLGDEVLFRYLVSSAEMDPSLYERLFKISDSAGNLIVGGVDASSPPVDDLYPIWCRDEGFCEIAETTDCYEEWRAYVGCMLGDPPLHTNVSDGGEGWLGTGTMYHIRVGEARRRENMTCPGIPHGWYKLLFSLGI